MATPDSGTVIGFVAPLGEFTQFVVVRSGFSCNTVLAEKEVHEMVAKPGALLEMLRTVGCRICTRPSPALKPAVFT